MANFRVVVEGGHVDVVIPKKGQVRIKGNRILGAKPDGKKWWGVDFAKFLKWVEENGKPTDF